MPGEPSETDTTVGGLSLQEAAEQLGVHYQTAYGWVRDGSLRAEKVRGRYRVTRQEIARFAEARDRPRPPGPRTLRKPERMVDKVFDQIVAGDEFSVRGELQVLADQGMDVGAVIEEVLAPAARRVGEAWHQGEIPVAIEHRATAIVERIIGDLMPNPRGRRRGTAVVAAVSGERHGLPLLMATAVLREDRWHVEHLGADCPADDIVRFGDRRRPVRAHHGQRHLGGGDRAGGRPPPRRRAPGPRRPTGCDPR